MKIGSFSSDRPITRQEDDQFQRYEFSKRIADIISKRESAECIVIGIYGAWGEGKTSIVNFVENELSKDENVISYKFNPWRYGDENALLLQFFQSLANCLNTKLKKKSEELGELLKKYGSVLSLNLPFIGNVGGALKGVGEALNDVDVETLRGRIEQALVESDQKIVVFIDDIDRLDKQEIYSVFRLVKLNGDFSNLIYVLSFDEQMVASALGERFDNSNFMSGQNFLEKIVQIPLKIPVAQREALNKFCFNLIDSVYQVNDLKLDESELRRFGIQFAQNILVRLTTPRLAIKYGNSISFSVPLLKGEANIVDLFLIEAIKIFYPNFYEFIKINPQFFIGSYSNRYGNAQDEDRRSVFKDHFERLCSDLRLNKKEKESVKELLQELFPVLKEVFINYNFSDRTVSNWTKNKQIASPKYFNRYFSYVVINGDISDIEFDEFIADIPSSDIDVVSKRIKSFVENSSPETMLSKLRIWENDFSWEVSIKLAKAIATVSEIFPKNEHLFQMSFERPNGQAGIFIRQLLANRENTSDKLKLAKELIDGAKLFDFAFTIYYWLTPDPKKEEDVFTKSEFAQLGENLRARALKESDEKPIFEIFPESARSIFHIWESEDKIGLNSYIEGFLKKNPQYIDLLIDAYTPTIISSSHPQPYKGNMDKAAYEYFISIVDKEIVYKTLKKQFKAKEIEEEEVRWPNRQDESNTSINAIRQFVHWYNGGHE